MTSQSCVVVSSNSLLHYGFLSSRFLFSFFFNYITCQSARNAFLTEVQFVEAPKTMILFLNLLLDSIGVSAL